MCMSTGELQCTVYIIGPRLHVEIEPLHAYMYMYKLYMYMCVQLYMYMYSVRGHVSVIHVCLCLSACLSVCLSVYYMYM